MDEFQLRQNEQLQHEILHQQQQQMADRQQQFQQNMAVQQEQQAAVQQRIQAPTAYERFFQNLNPLPAVPVAQGAAPVEAPAQTKAQKRAEERQKKRMEKENEQQYARVNKQLSAQPRLVDETELRDMHVFQQKSTRDKWAQQKLPHYALTREETLRRIMNDGDYSNFENLDLLMRNVVAGRELKKFLSEYPINENSNPQEICRLMKEHAGPDAGVSPFVNPALRLALSLAQKTDGIPDGLKQFYHNLDEAMSTEVMVATLTHQADRRKVRDYFAGRGVSNPDTQTDAAITANKAQQIQIAKRLLLMQLSDFRKITTRAGGEVDDTPWDSSMAVALSHCSRVVLTLPRTDEAASSVQEQQAMWRSILTIGGENTAQDNSRASSTHSIERRSVRDAGAVRSKEKKKLFNLIGQRGMNCAIGGLGNAGVSAKTICNDGSCGHFYSMHKEADADHYGAMLMGIESDAAGVMNQMGHTHDIHATAEKASSLGGQRTDEIGNKYGGRQCNLTGMSAHDISAWMQALETKMLQWQSPAGGVNDDEAVAAMRRLAGGKLDAAGWTWLRRTLGVGAGVADGFHP